jgi:hypothetical protein
MAAKLRELLRRKDGDSAVEFIMTSAVLILVFAMFVSALVYVTQYYNASFLCRKVVRSIEVKLTATGTISFPTVFSQYGFCDLNFSFTVRATNYDLD